MSKSRKDQFEEQLKDLQKDISKLSQKLSTPPLADSRNGQSDAHNTSTASILSLMVFKDVRSHRSIGSISHLDVHDASKTLEKLRIELHHSNKERDDAIYKLEQARLEIDQLKKGIQETARLRAALDHLKQDHDSLRISLESSERIRKQQKDLINLLQRSHAISAAAGGIVHPVDVTPAKIDNSLLSHHSAYAPAHHDQSLLSHHTTASQHSHHSEPQYHQHQHSQQQQQEAQQGSLKIKRRIKPSGSSVSSASHRATASGSVASTTASGVRSQSGGKVKSSGYGRRTSTGSVGTSSSKRSNHSKSSKAPVVDLSYSTVDAASTSYQDILQPNRSLVPPSAALVSGSVLSYNPPPAQQAHQYGGGGSSTILTTDNMSFISALGNGSTSRVLFDSHSAPSSRATSRSNSFDLGMAHHPVTTTAPAAPSSSSSGFVPGRPSAFTFSDSSIDGAAASQPSSAYPQYPPPQPHPLPQYQSPYRLQQTAAPTPPRPPSAHPSGGTGTGTGSVASGGKPPRHPPSGRKAPPAPLYISTPADHSQQHPHQHQHQQQQSLYSHSAPSSPRHSPRKHATPTKSSLKKVLIRSPRSLPTYEQYQALTSHTSGLLSPSRKVKKIRAMSAPHNSVLVGGGHTASSAARLGKGESGPAGSPSRLFNVPIPSPATTFGHSDRKLH